SKAVTRFHAWEIRRMQRLSKDLLARKGLWRRYGGQRAGRGWIKRPTATRLRHSLLRTTWPITGGVPRLKKNGAPTFGCTETPRNPSASGDAPLHRHRQRNRV